MIDIESVCSIQYIDSLDVELVTGEEQGKTGIRHWQCLRRLIVMVSWGLVHMEAPPWEIVERIRRIFVCREVRTFLATNMAQSFWQLYKMDYTCAQNLHQYLPTDFEG